MNRTEIQKLKVCSKNQPGVVSIIEAEELKKNL